MWSLSPDWLCAQHSPQLALLHGQSKCRGPWQGRTTLYCALSNASLIFLSSCNSCWLLHCCWLFLHPNQVKPLSSKISCICIWWSHSAACNQQSACAPSQWKLKLMPSFLQGEKSTSDSAPHSLLFRSHFDQDQN